MSHKLMRAIDIVVILFIVNLFWLIGTILGLVVLGIVPSTAALIHVLQLPNLFREEYSYKELLFVFAKNYWQVLKKYNWRLMISPFAIGVGYLEIKIIQASDLMKSLFQWPIVVLIGYIILVTISYFILDNYYENERRVAKLKVSVIIPFILPLQGVIFFIMLGCFSVIVLAHSWFGFLAIPLFFYGVNYMYVSVFKKKGLVSG